MKNTIGVGLLITLAGMAQAEIPCYGLQAGPYCARLLGQGMAELKVNEQYQLIDRNGKTLGLFSEQLGEFREGLAAASSPDGRQGFIGTDGQWRLAARWSHLWPFASGHALAQTADDAPWQIIDRSGLTVATLPADYQPDSSLWNGLATVTFAGPQKLWSPTQGGWPLPPDTRPLGRPDDGLLPASNKAGKAGYLNAQEQWQLPAIFDDARSFSGRFAAVRQGAQWSLIDRQGRILRSLPGAQVYEGHSHWQIVLANPEVRWFLNSDGSSPYPAGIDPEKFFTALAQQHQENGYRINPVEPGTRGLPLAILEPPPESKLPAKVVLSDGTLKTIAGAISFGAAGSFQTEMPFVVETQSGWGAINARGEWVIAPRFKMLETFRKGRAVFQQFETEGLVDAEGKVWLPKDGSRWNHVTPEGIAIFSQGDAYGALDIFSGRILLAATPDHLGQADGFVVPRYSKESHLEGLWHLREARWLTPPACDDLDWVAEGTWLCKFERGSGKKPELQTRSGERMPISDLRRNREEGHFEILAAGKRGVLLGDGQLIWTPGSQRYQPWFPDARSPWFFSGQSKRTGWIDTRGQLRYSVESDPESMERLYRFDFSPDMVFGKIEGVDTLLNLQTGQKTPVEPDTFAYQIDDMIVRSRGSRRSGGQTSVTLPDGQTLTQKGGWHRVGSGLLAVNPESIDADTALLWQVKTGTIIPTPYAEISDAGRAGWLMAWDGQKGRRLYLDQKLKPVLPTSYSDGLPFSDGITWVTEGQALKLIDEKGRTLGQIGLQCAKAEWQTGGGALRCARPQTK